MLKEQATRISLIYILQSSEECFRLFLQFYPALLCLSHYSCHTVFLSMSPALHCLSHFRAFAHVAPSPNSHLPTLPHSKIDSAHFLYLSLNVTSSERPDHAIWRFLPYYSLSLPCLCFLQFLLQKLANIFFGFWGFDSSLLRNSENRDHVVSLVCYFILRA